MDFLHLGRHYGLFRHPLPEYIKAWVGEMLVEGLAGAVDKDGKKAVNAIGGMSEQMLDEVDSGSRR